MMLSTISGYDYGVFALSLLVPVFVSLHCACVGTRKTPAAFLLADRKLRTVPIGFSVALAFVSSTLVTGIPGQVAYHGLLYPVTTLAAATLGLLLVGNLFLPMFCKMRLTSVHEYLELRYNSRLLRRLCSASYCLSTLLFLSVCLAAPCNALKTVTGLPVFSIILLGGIVGTFYTVMSGLRGSVWSSLFQAMVLFAGAGAITLRSSLMASASGNGSESADSVVGAILTSAPHVFNLDPSPFSKTASTTWALGAGQVVQWAWLFGCSQTAVQRYSAARTLAHARGALFLSTLIMWLLFGVATACGLALHASYWSCDPVAEKLVSKEDEVATLFLLQHLVQYHSLSGVFLASLLSGALSTLSAGLHSVTTVIWEDFLRHCRPFNSNRRDPADEQKQLRVCRTVLVVLGCLTSGFAYAAADLMEAKPADIRGAAEATPVLGDSALQLSNVAVGVFAGPLLAVYFLGFFTAIANKYGVLCGFLAGQAAPLWLAFGAAFVRPSAVWLHRQQQTGIWENGTLVTIFSRRLFTDGCSEDISVAEFRRMLLNGTEEPPFFFVPEGDWQTVLYSVSTDLYPLVGFLVCLLVGLVGSLLTHFCLGSKRKRPVEQLLLHPLVRKYYFYDKGGLARPPTSALADPRWPMPPPGVQLHHPGFFYDDSGRFCHSEDFNNRSSSYETHYRWPSPSLPPTLTKKKARSGAGNVADAKPSNTSRRSRRESSSAATHTDEIPSSEITGESAAAAASAATLGENDVVVSSSKNTKTFSRQHVIQACEKRTSLSTSSDSSTSSSSSTTSNDDDVDDADDDVDDDSEVELDEFGDVVPPHLRRTSRDDGKKKTRKSQVYQVQEQQKKEWKLDKQEEVKPAEDECGWTTDF